MQMTPSRRGDIHGELTHQAGLGGGGAYYLGAYPTPELLDALWAGPLAKFVPAGSLLAGAADPVPYV